MLYAVSARLIPDRPASSSRGSLTAALPLNAPMARRSSRRWAVRASGRTERCDRDVLLCHAVETRARNRARSLFHRHRHRPHRRAGRDPRRAADGQTQSPGPDTTLEPRDSHTGHERASVTVFGGTGFLGRRIVDALLARDVTVRVAARHPAPRRRRQVSTAGFRCAPICATPIRSGGARWRPRRGQCGVALCREPRCNVPSDPCRRRRPARTGGSRRRARPPATYLGHRLRHPIHLGLHPRAWRRRGRGARGLSRRDDPASRA